MSKEVDRREYKARMGLGFGAQRKEYDETTGKRSKCNYKDKFGLVKHLWKNPKNL